MNNLNNYTNLINEHSLEFESYFKTLVSFNEKVNLTAIVKREEVYIKHFLDSILGINELKTGSRVIDVGTGAGFPGLPIKIVRPDIDLTLLDSLNKRIVFLDEITAKLNIKTTNIHARAEEYIGKNRECFDVALSRAVASMNTLAEYLLPYVKVGGIMLAYKSTNVETELTESKIAISKLGGKLDKILNFTLPNNMGERKIVVIKKIKPTPIQYPRQQNKPKTHPLK